MLIDELRRDDVERDNVHKLTIPGEDDDTVFEITLDTSRNCESYVRTFECDTSRDRFCRCDRRGEQCCDLSRGCTKGNCCEDCRSQRDDDCNLCNDDGDDCYRGEQSGRLGDEQCRDGDRDCICVENDDRDEYCCSEDRDCEGKYCCESCRDGDRDCFCDRDDNCVIFESLKDEQCRDGDRDCICVENDDRDEYCCSEDRDCRGKFCCESCREGDRDCFCDRDDNCVIFERLEDERCRDGDRDCLCVEDERGDDFCCDNSRDCRGSLCCEECDEKRRYRPTW